MGVEASVRRGCLVGNGGGGRVELGDVVGCLGGGWVWWKGLTPKSLMGVGWIPGIMIRFTSDASRIICLWLA